MEWLSDKTIEALINSIGSIVNAVILTIIFVFLNDVLFLSRYYKYDTKENRKIITKKLRRLIPLSPIGLILALSVLLIGITSLMNLFMKKMGVISFIPDI